MIPFGYTRPADEAGALHAGSTSGVAFIAGGTGMVDLMRLGVETPATLVDLNALPWTKVEKMADGGLSVGALVKNSDLAWHPEVRARYPVLAEALLAGASPQLRNMATVGGNLLQRTRCAYFRDIGVSACNKRTPGSGCAALDGGFVRMHAVLGGSSHCIALHPSDMCVALVALDAVVHVRGPRGERSVPISEFHVVPGAHPEVESVLARGELVTAITVPPTPFAARSAYVKVRDRASYAFALASAAVAFHLDDGVVRDVRVALGGVATKPWRSQEAEQSLRGQPPTRAVFERAAAAALKDARPRPGNEFKVPLAQRVLVRALERAGGIA
ncbi:xanthine dehydrogenase family protein subunit M [Pendulispora brunnea]|uniref:Xanthine dehydrogenase family protein subunit M n=1 Tax=Pendulispora brunnea TaxID=2905690 RepID=A0ABZ2KAK3_9BACT